MDLRLANADYGTPGSVDLFLEPTCSVVLFFMHCWWFGPSGIPLAFKNQFGWELIGTICHKNQQMSCYFMTTEESPQYSDELLNKYWEIDNLFLHVPTLTFQGEEIGRQFQRK